MTDRCPNCGTTLVSWIANREQFKCPGCKAALTSNRKKSFRRSLVVALIAWLIFLVVMRQQMGSWGVAAAVSLEGGGILSAAVAALYYHMVVKIEAAK